MALPTPKPSRPAPAPPSSPLAPLAPPADLADRARELGVEFEPTDVERLSLYLAHLLEANKTTNLTAITDPADAWHKHILDALTLLPLIAALGEDDAEDDTNAAARPPLRITPSAAASTPPSKQPTRIIDIGSGGGVPALPLAIVMPDVHFTLVEATGKKVAFLRETISALGLANATVINSRAETLGQEKPHRERYDGAIARALGHLAVVAELTVPLVRLGGVVLAVKGAKADAEVAESAACLDLLCATHDQTVPTPTGRIVVLSKLSATPATYPRRDGEPKARPLGMAKPTS